MQKRTLILIAHARRVQRLRRDLLEAAGLLGEELPDDEMVHKLLTDQFWELADEVHHLQVSNGTEQEIQRGA